MDRLETQAIMAAIIYASRTGMQGFHPDKHRDTAAKEAKELYEALEKLKVDQSFEADM